jgi:hypothetical protein
MLDETMASYNQRQHQMQAQGAARTPVLKFCFPLEIWSLAG